MKYIVKHMTSRALWRRASFYAIGICLYANSQGAELTLVPKSGVEAHDIVETRLWVRDLTNKLISYRSKQVREHGPEIADPSNVRWPAPEDLTTIIRIGSGALKAEEPDWNTLCDVMSCVAIFTPVDARLETLAVETIKAKLPPEINGDHWATLSNAMVVLAKQGSAEGRELLVSSVGASFWEGSHSIYTESTKGSKDPCAATRSILRCIAVDSVALWVPPGDAINILTSLKATETDDVVVQAVIAGALEKAKLRSEGKPFSAVDSAVPSK